MDGGNLTKFPVKFSVPVFLTMSILVASCSATSSLDQSEKVNAMSDKINYQPQGILAKSLAEIAQALNSDEISSQELVKLYLQRIDAVDKNGPTLQAVLTINPDAIADAKVLDQMKARGISKGPLHGVPILIKDNIETKDAMATTAGALALKNNLAGRDSPLVTGLRKAGAIILGKTNLSQWANFRSENSMSGWSVLGGQVRNPHMLDRNPCGSSSGSGAATAASLAAASIGTETDGSVICPSNVNGIVGFKPSVGLVSQQYIIPISASQDTAGPMTKTVTDAAIMMNAMVSGKANMDFLSGLKEDALKAVRVGVLNFAIGDNKAIKTHFNSALIALEEAGAILVKIDKSSDTPDDHEKLAYDLLKYEFKDGLNRYLASTSPERVKTRSLEQLIAFNEVNAKTEQALFDQSIFESSQQMNAIEGNPVYISTVASVKKVAGKEGIDLLLKNMKWRF